MADRSAPELGGLEGAHWEPWLPRRRRTRAVLTVLLVVVVLGLAAFATVLLVTDGPGELWRLTPAVGPLLSTPLLGRAGVELARQGIRTRHGVVRRRWRPWADVARVRPAGRWDLWPVAVLDHERLDLRGLTSEDAERLAAALDVAREGQDEPAGARG